MYAFEHQHNATTCLYVAGFPFFRHELAFVYHPDEARTVHSPAGLQHSRKSMHTTPDIIQFCVNTISITHTQSQAAGEIAYLCKGVQQLYFRTCTISKYVHIARTKNHVMCRIIGHFHQLLVSVQTATTMHVNNALLCGCK